jgi:hypothetical protein
MIFGCETTPQPIRTEERMWSWGGVNKEQPIFIGEEIYSSTKGGSDQGGWYATMSYTYMGLDDKNNIKIVRRLDYKPSYREALKVETLYLMLPLSQKKQTIIKVISYEDFPRVVLSTKELLITVVDDFGRITVEEIGKSQTK